MTSPASAHRRTVLVGAACGLTAAALWGASAPVSKLLLPQVPPLLLASLLYLGAGAGLTAFALARPRAAAREAPLRRADLPMIVGMTLAGGICGPVLLLLGLERLTGVTASLLLNLEAPFTIAIAVALFREHLSGRGVLAAAVVLAGATLLAFHSGGGELRASWIGVACIAGACLAWGIDNNLAQRMSLRDPVTVVRYKTIPAGCTTLALALLVGQRLPPGRVLLWALLLGVVSYGVGIVLHVVGLRLLGAARAAAFFATAPFVGAVVSLPVLRERLSLFDLLGGAVMALGVALLVTERHEHSHAHDAMEHEHAHVHDAHHQHAHAAGEEPADGHEHSHVHVHEALVHSHAHVSDLHHRHDH